MAGLKLGNNSISSFAEFQHNLVDFIICGVQMNDSRQAVVKYEQN